MYDRTVIASDSTVTDLPEQSLQVFNRGLLFTVMRDYRQLPFYFFSAITSKTY